MLLYLLSAEGWLTANFQDAKTSKESVIAQGQHILIELENQKQQLRREDEEMQLIRSKYEEHDRKREALTVSAMLLISGNAS